MKFKFLFSFHNNRSPYTMSKIPLNVTSKIGLNLHNSPGHPIEIIKNHIYAYFDSIGQFNKFDDIHPKVTVVENFDSLLIPPDHSSRSSSDTFYYDDNSVLRTHTSAHQVSLLKRGFRNFLVTGDVYRKDEIDARHYPVFHQMEGIFCVSNEEDLKNTLKGLIEYLFPGCEYRFNPDYFPFTYPSYEIEVMYNSKWLEVLGCGITHSKILSDNAIDGLYAAFGLGLDRLAMIFFKIPDIRYIWCTDDKFLTQFRSGIHSVFKPYSILEPITHAISFWINDSNRINNDKWVDENDFFTLVHDECDIWVKEVFCFDKFFNNKSNKWSRAYNIVYESIDHTMTNPAEFEQLCREKQANLIIKLREFNKITIR